MFNIFNFKWNKSHIKQYDKSANYFDIAYSLKDNPISLIYLVNLISKEYVLNRAIALLNNNTHCQSGAKSWVSFNKIPIDTQNYYDEKNIVNIINLQSSSIVPWAWETSRLIDCFKHIDTIDSPWRADINHRVYFSFPMCISLVISGNHSITTGIIKGSDAEWINESYYDLSEIYKYIQYKNFTFYTPEAKFKSNPNEQIIDIVFEIGRLILNNNFQYQDYINEYQNKYSPENSMLSNEFLDLNMRIEKFTDLIGIQT